MPYQVKFSEDCTIPDNARQYLESIDYDKIYLFEDFTFDVDLCFDGDDYNDSYLVDVNNRLITFI